MSTVSQTAALGKPFFTEDSSFRARDNESDNYTAGTYTHKNIEFSANEAGEWVSYFMFLRSMLQNGIHHFKVRNETGGALTAGTLLYVSGYSAANTAFLIAKADCDDPTKMPMLVLDASVSNNANGNAWGVVTVSNLDTSAYAAVGDRVYADGASGGGVGLTTPTAPTRATSQQHWVGTITVKDAAIGEIRFFPGANRLLKIGNSFLQDGMAIVKCVKVTKAYTDFSTAGTSNSIEILSLPAKGVLKAIYTKHNTAFSGGAISAYTVESGITGDTTKYTTPFDVFQAVADTAAARQGPVSLNELEAHTAATSIKATARSTGANLNAATAGSVDFWIEYIVYP